MANSYVLYPGLAGAQTDFSIPFEYLSQDYVKATVGGTPVSLTFLSTYMVRITPAPSGNLRIYRDTPKDPVVTYTNGSILVDSDVNASFLQSLHISEEVAENAMQTGTNGHWDATNLRIQNVANPVNANDAVNKGWYDTTMTADKAYIDAAKATVNSDKGIVAADKAIVAADKATVATDKGITEGYKNDAAASAAAAAASAGANTDVSTQIGAAALQATPSDTDMVGYRRNSDGGFRKLSWTNIKAFLKTYFDTVYALTGHSHADVTAGGASGFMSGADKTKLNAVGTNANRAATISTSAPSGGTDGDVWYVVV
jgi:hypothetical protein